MIDVRQQAIREARRLLAATEIAPTERESLADILDLLVTSLQKYTGPDDLVEAVRHLTNDLISNQPLLALLGQQAAELDALKKLSLNLTSSLDLTTVLDAVVTEAIRLVKNASMVSIYLYSNQKLEFGAALDAEGKRYKPSEEPRPPLLTYTVASKGETIIVEDMRYHPINHNGQKEMTGSIIGIPLKISKSAVGVMNLTRTTTGPFSSAELRLLQLLSDQAAIAIINARLHEKVSLQANSDTVTGLPNRRALDEHLENEVRNARRTGRTFAVVMMDLDGFKDINDTYGHATGDQVLRLTFNYLAQGLRSSDFLARYGGDELTLTLSQTDLMPVLVVTEKITEKLENFSIDMPDGAKLKLTMTGGIAIYPTHGSTAAELLRAADEALYRAKRHQRGSFLVARGPTGPLTTQTSASE